jgi:hypothetical protein
MYSVKVLLPRKMPPRTRRKGSKPAQQTVSNVEWITVLASYFRSACYADIRQQQ